ncbi:C45 family autoproteolytic acyltransferase/hydolase [Pseudonocardia alaniniphila]|uniref:C45 family autoproteolytic acyltransferase/hydrolase n=1 Tax=Pseudonocardia alaniniphila TaxID=75291 RepID=A0ABS9TF82_9PSEU|nr:C45 family autoproteolytic acyltransferase/hydolase [Pseudonocardia alaniniphila]MCH6167068.1 C45 family autoproteolytic acyltransferase/hydrolase [Pseudonocardia alaniniphila]
MTTTTGSVRSEIVAGSTADFMLVRHVSASGSQAEIGRVLAEEARSTYGWSPVPTGDRVLARARRRWFERNWPQHHARLQGVAEAAGVDYEADAFHLDGLTGVPDGSACSAAYCPPGSTAEGHALLGRNYDFFTTSQAALFAMLAGHQVEDAGPPMAARPYVLASVPDDGPATTLITMNELDGCMEGVNEHGLAVALLIADGENASAPIDAWPQVGLASAQLPRFLLDTCASVEDAKAALLDAKQYDLGTPLHYLVGDASGAAFVWERGPGGDEHITESDGALCVTNHLLHRNPDVAALPEDNEESMLSYQRYRRLHGSTGGAMSAVRLRESLDEIRFDAATAESYPVRTLWRTVFDLQDRSMSTHFFLGEDETGLRYSEELVFTAVH